MAGASVEVAAQHAIPVFEALATTPLAWASGRLGTGDPVALQRQALAGMARTGTGVLQPCAHATLAQLLADRGDTDGAFTQLADALELSERSEERYYDAELHRLRARILLAAGDRDGARVAASVAVSVAEAQGTIPFTSRARQLVDELDRLA